MRDAQISRARPFRWLWQDRVLLGYLNLMMGEEGTGKSTFVAWVAARTTRGELPGTLEGKPGRVLVIGDEDGWDGVWTPRLAAAGADSKFCKNIASAADGSPVDVTNPEHMTDLEAYVREHEVKLLFFDQLLDHLGFTDNWKDKQVRAALAPLRSLAEKTGCAVLFSMHPNKRQGSFRERVSGTPAFNALSRSSLLVAHHPHEHGRVVVVRAKGNYSEEPSAFEFSLVKRVVGSRKILTTTVDQTAETALRAADVLDAAPSRRRADSKAGAARREIAAVLADGGEHWAKPIQERLRTELDIPYTTSKDAATTLGVIKRKKGFDRGWTWQKRTRPR